MTIEWENLVTVLNQRRKPSDNPAEVNLYIQVGGSEKAESRDVIECANGKFIILDVNDAGLVIGVEIF